MLVPFSVGPGESRVLIPEAWTAFTYRGFLYVRGDDGRFVVRAKVADENKSFLAVKSA